MQFILCVVWSGMVGGWCRWVVRGRGMVRSGVVGCGGVVVNGVGLALVLDVGDEAVLVIGVISDDLGASVGQLHTVLSLWCRITLKFKGGATESNLMTNSNYVSNIHVHCK